VKHPRPWQRCAALIAAYALVLQALVTAFTPPALAIAAAFEICRSGSAADPAQQHPQSQHECSACLAGHCAGAAATPDRVVIPVPWPATTLSAVIPSLAALALPSAHELPHSPRAPPLG
jgi:hypothetical protein